MTARILAPTLCLAILTSGTALAKDMNGKFGVGYDQSLGGMSGLNLKYYLGDVAIWTTFGFDYFKPDPGDDRMGFAAAIGGIYNFARSEQANLGIGLRANFGFRNAGAMNGSDGSFQFNMELPLVAEFFFTDHFSIHAGTGILLVIVPAKGRSLDVDDSTSGVTSSASTKGIGVGIGNGSLIGNAGFTYYF